MIENTTILWNDERFLLIFFPIKWNWSTEKIGVRRDIEINKKIKIQRKKCKTFSKKSKRNWFFENKMCKKSEQGNTENNDFEKNNRK